MKIPFDYGCSTCNRDAEKSPDRPDRYQEVAAGLLVSSSPDSMEIIQGHDGGIYLDMEDCEELIAAINRAREFQNNLNAQQPKD